jgi:PAS domain S-box-containing protein
MAMSSTEAKAALAKRHFEAILTSAGEGIYGIDSEARLVFMNTRAREMLGLELDFDVIGKSAHALNRHSISETEPCDGKNCHVIQTMRDGLPRRSDDQYFRRQDGTLFPIELSASAIIEDGVKVGAVVVFSDISDRKRNLEQLRSSQQLLDTIVENLPDMVCLKRVDNLRFEMINRTGLEWLGLSLEQAIGKDAQNVMPKEMTDCRSEQDSRALQHCGRIDSIEETIVTLKGVRVLNTKKATPLICWVFQRTSPNVSAPKNRSSIWPSMTSSPSCPTVPCYWIALASAWRPHSGQGDSEP